MAMPTTRVGVGFSVRGPSCAMMCHTGGGYGTACGFGCGSAEGIVALGGSTTL